MKILAHDKYRHYLVGDDNADPNDPHTKACMAVRGVAVFTPAKEMAVFFGHMPYLNPCPNNPAVAAELNKLPRRPGTEPAPLEGEDKLLASLPD